MSGTLGPRVDETGIHVPTYPENLAALQTRMRAIFGPDIYLDNDSQDGQVLAIVAKAWADTNDLAIGVYNAFSPASAQGTGLSSQVKINGISRHVPSRSTVDLLITGQAGTVITGGAAEDANAVRWNLPSPTTIPFAGQLTVTATAAELGDKRAAPTTIILIATPTRGWQLVTNPTAANPGSPVESDALLRIRQAVSTELPSLTVLDGLIGAVATITGVTRYRAYENDGSTTDANGLPAHSIALVVDGGDAQAIISTIGLKKAPGAGTHGTTVGTYTDFYSIPHVVKFFRPTKVPITVVIQIDNLPNYTSVIGVQLREAVVKYINSLRIGETVYWSKVFVPANLSNGIGGETYEIDSIMLSRNAAPPASADVVILFNEAAEITIDSVTLTVV